MTKEELVEEIVTISRECKSEDEFRQYLTVTLNLLEPTDRVRFSLYGKEKSTPEDCWDTNI